MNLEFLRPSNLFNLIFNPEARRRVRGVQSKVESARPREFFGATTEMGTAGSAAPRIPEESKLWSQRYDRRSIIYDVRKMLADNPMLAEAASVFVDTALSKSFTVTVDKSAKRGVTAGLQSKAQRIIDRVIRDCKLKEEVPSWAKRALREGDLFIQPVVEEGGGTLCDAVAMPTVSMERLSDNRDHFSDPLACFRQVDITTNETIALFAQWQMIHARWEHESGERYGNSQYLQLRTMNKLFLKMVTDMAIRRHVRGPLRRFHQVGNEKNPGSWDDVEKYIALNKMDDNVGIQEDYYGTFNVMVHTLEGDAKLSEIEDVQFILNVLFPRTGIAKGLIGFGEEVSRDILDDQREFLHTRQDLLIDWVNDHVLRPLFNLALLLEDINPDAISYTIQFEDRATEAAKLARLEICMEMNQLELMTDRQFVERAAPFLNLKDIDAYLDELREWRAERAREKQEAMQTGTAPAKPEDEPRSIAKRGIQKSTIGQRGNVRRAAFGRR
jgi:hypothetical protein